MTLAAAALTLATTLVLWLALGRPSAPELAIWLLGWVPGLVVGGLMVRP